MLANIALYIWKIFPPGLFILGTLGNVTSISVLMKSRNRNSSIARYLSALAVSDLIVLWVALPRNWLLNGFGVDIRNYSDFVCKVQLYLLYTGSQCSTCMVVAVTIERFFATWLPFKQKTTCTDKKASIIIMCVTTSIALLNAHFIYGMTTRNMECYPIDENYAHFFFNYLPKGVIVIFSFIPLAILFTVNMSIIIRMSVLRRRAKRVIFPQTINQIERNKMVKYHNITVLLVVLGIVYMMCVTPILVFLLTYSDWVLSRARIPTNDVLEIVWSVVNFLFYTNFSVNFLLYFLSRTSFRKEAKLLFKSVFFCRYKQQ